MTVVAIVIPYYQRKPGILRRALISVLPQRLPSDVRVSVIVVDDGSPVPAQTEVATLDFTAPFELALIEQPNAGIAAARNTALRRVEQPTTYIAFLDSDDIWHPHHLATAITALNRGCDFYFFDGQRSGSSRSFSQTQFSHFLDKHAKNVGGAIYDLDSKPFFDEAIRARPFGTPTVVYRRSVALDLTFDTSLRRAGEDCLFFFQLIPKCRRICCCSDLMVTYGDGVNVHASLKHSWDDPSHLLQQMVILLACYKLRDCLSLSEKNQHLIAYRIKKDRAKFAFFTIRYFIKKREWWSQELRDTVHSDPQFLIWYPLYALYVSLCFLLRLYHPAKPDWTETEGNP